MAIESPYKVVEYPESPSGYVTFYNYKEPFTPFTDGHGYEGVLLYDTAENKVQCHICGKWFDFLSVHSFRAHGLNARAYKEKVGLRARASLISEKLREKRLGRDFTKQIAAMNAARLAPSKGQSEAIKRGTNSAEYKNSRGTCPEQLLQRIKDKCTELGRVPNMHEVKGLGTILKVFGKWNEAIRLAGFLPREHGDAQTDEFYLELIRNFRASYGRLPCNSDIKRRIFPQKSTIRAHFGTWAKAVQCAFPDEIFPQWQSQTPHSAP